MCRVTKATVSHALRGNRRRVSEAKMTLIRRTADRLGYDAASQHIARRLSLRKEGKTTLNRLVGLFFPPYFFEDTYYLKMVQGIMEVLTAQRFGLLASYDNAPASCGELPASFVQGDVDGTLVVANPDSFTPVIEELRSRWGYGNRPIVSLIEQMETCSAVVADDRGGAFEAAGHLLELGHRRILYLAAGSTDAGVCRDRIAGYRDAYEALELHPADHLCVCDTIGGARDGMRQAAARMLDAHPDVTAILAPNDMCAVWIHEVLAERGLRVPQHMSLIGFDDARPLLDDAGENILTTVRVPLEDIGRRAAQLVVDLVKDQNASERHLVLPTELVTRASTAPPVSLC